jgi:hypothetical protein
MKRILVLALLVAAGCGAEVSQTVITDPAPPGGAWGEIALTVTGPGANNDKRKACMQEARNAGVRLREGSPTAAALYLADDGNRLSFADGRPERPLGKWTARAVCRVAISIVLRLDERVRTANGQAPPQCRMLGTVEGQDQGYAFFVVQLGSYEAALAQMQISALRMGGNFVSVDVVRQLGLITSLNGRAFDCGGGPQSPNAPPGQQI